MFIGWCILTIPSMYAQAISDYFSSAKHFYRFSNYKDESVAGESTGYEATSDSLKITIHGDEVGLGETNYGARFELSGRSNSVGASFATSKTRSLSAGISFHMN